MYFVCLVFLEHNFDHQNMLLGPDHLYLPHKNFPQNSLGLVDDLAPKLHFNLPSSGMCLLHTNIIIGQWVK